MGRIDMNQQEKYDYFKYARQDAENLIGIYGQIHAPNTKGARGYNTMPIQVIHNNRTTILVWEDKTKTIVKAMQGEKVDKQLGFLIAFFQKHSGLSKGKANEYLEQFIEKKKRNCNTCKHKNLSPLTTICFPCDEYQNWEEV